MTTRKIDERDFYYGRDNHHNHLSSKVIKYEKICDVNQYVFIPSAFSIFKFLEREAADLLQRVQMVMYNNFVFLGSIEGVVFNMIGFAI